MGGAIVILLFLPLLNRNRINSTLVNPFMKASTYVFFSVFLLLGWLGAQPVEDPYVFLSQLCTLLYFVYFFAVFFCTLRYTCSS